MNDHTLPSISNDAISVPMGMTMAEIDRLANTNELQSPEPADRPREAWIWDGLLMRGQISLLLGSWKIGKTTFIAELIRRVSSGESCLGHRVNPTPIRIITDEPYGLWAKRHRANPLPSDLQFWSYDTIGVNQSVRLTELVRMAAFQKPGLIIVDSLGRFLPAGAENNTSIMTRCIDRMRSVSGDAALLFTHHPSKTRSRDMACRGGSLLPSAAQSVMELLPYSPDPAESNRRLLRIRSRLPPSPITLAYEWHPANQQITAIDPPASAHERLEMEVIQMLLAERPDGRATVRNLLADWPTDAAPISRHTLIRRLQRATDRHALTRTGRGINSDPFVYSLPTPT
jgi:hypothetical protein